jgi:hypothetical protein
MADWEELDLGPIPAMEECAQVGARDYDYRERALAECRQYIAAIKKKLGEPPDGCELRVKSNPHDFGTYYSVVARFNPKDAQAVDYSYGADGNAPMTWEEVGMTAPIVKRGKGR